MTDQEKNLLPETTYSQLLSELKTKIQTAQIKAALALNAELIRLYWDIGNTIWQRQKQEGWGAKTIERLAKDLKSAFPENKGFSSSNLKYMRRFAEEYPNLTIGQQPADQLPWWHNVILMTKVEDIQQREWYAYKTIEHGWSRNILEIQIQTKLYERQVVSEKITNFDQRLPAAQSDLAKQTLKDPYVFDFLSVGKEAHEREIENALVQHITKFLLELGTGFAFIGQQYHLEIGGDDFYIDLLFYHIKLRCFVVVDLKAGKFNPHDAGQINFYLSAVDETLKHPSDNPSIGILLCRDKNKLVAEYALKDINKPIGVSSYQLVESIPEPLKTSLPTIEELELGLGNIDIDDAQPS